MPSFVPFNRDQFFLLPPDLKEWLPENDLEQRSHGRNRGRGIPARPVFCFKLLAGLEAAAMGRPYSDDLRTRVAASVVAGRSCRAVAEVFGVSAASAVKWSQRLRQTGSAAAKAMGGARRAVLAGERDWLRARIKVAPDLTLRALAAELAERGVVVSHWAVWKFCQDEALTFKKKHSAKRAGSRRCRPPSRPLA